MCDVSDVATAVTDPDAWDALVAAAPDGEVFHTSAWLDLLERSFRVRSVRLGLVRSGRLVAGLPLLLRRIGPFVVAGSPLYNVATPQMGPICQQPEDFEALWMAFEALQARRRVAFAEVIFGSPRATRVLDPLGYVIEPSRTLILDLAGRTPDDVWRGFEGRCRTAIRKAERLGVAVSLATDLSFLPDYRALAQLVYSKSRRPPPTPDAFYQILWQRFAPTGALRVLTARYHGETVAAAIFLAHAGRFYYLDGVSNAQGNQVCANNLLQWEALQWALAERLHTYDMVGAGIASIARFKASFGGVVVERPMARRARSLAARVALRVVRRALPLVRRAALRWGVRTPVTARGAA